MVQMANITVMPKSDSEPRKFSKYNPGRKKRGRNTTEELIYIRQNYPVKMPGNSTVWNRHGALPVTGTSHRNIEIQHISTTPSIAHSNSFGDKTIPSRENPDILSNTSSEVPSRTSSISNLRPGESHAGPYLTQDSGKYASGKTSPKKNSQITPR